MNFHIIIDGYNLIRQTDFLRSRERFSMESGREALIEALAYYKRYKSHQITVVFDGNSIGSFMGNRDWIKGIEVLFSRCGESADAVIKRLAAKKREKAVVVSSDLDVVQYAEAHGATTIDSRSFQEKMVMANYMMMKGADGADQPEVVRKVSTKKKGPRRRLPKSKRKQLRKIGQL